VPMAKAEEVHAPSSTESPTGPFPGVT
jgi:hypothetical protein